MTSTLRVSDEERRDRSIATSRQRVYLIWLYVKAAVITVDKCRTQADFDHAKALALSTVRRAGGTFQQKDTEEMATDILLTVMREAAPAMREVRFRAR